MPKKYTWYWNYIQENNKGRHDKTKEKLYRRVLSARSRWADKYDLDKSDIDKLIKKSLGKKCPYCGEIITTENMSLDHMNPQTKGGSNSLDNLHIVDNICNRRKGELTHEEYKSLINLINTEFSKESKKYIKRKLSAKTWY
ncbi:MAG: HNH endonuclease [Elusimicrobiota bacterium]